MSENQFQNRAKTLKDAVSSDLKKEISPYECNVHISNLESLKSDLYDDGNEWTEDLDEVEEVDEEEMLSYEEIGNALEEVHHQVERIISELEE